MSKHHGAALTLAASAFLLFLAACGGDPLGVPAGSGGSLSSLAGGATASNASGTIRLRCELRTGRSKISVDGKNLAAGMYSARVASGGNSASAPAMATVGDEVEFDFDSDPGDIASGATAIAADFIQTSASPAVSADILDASGGVILSVEAACAQDTGRRDDRADNEDNGDDDHADDDHGGDTGDEGEASFSTAAGTLELECEVRTVRGRSKISVDGEDLASGMYSAMVTSGANSVSAGPMSTVGDEVEFDFDSDPGDIAAGATAIAGDFIDISSSPHVSAEILAADGTVVVSGGTDCRVRND